MARVGNKFSLSGRLGLNADNFDKGLRKAGRTFDNFQRNIRDKNHILGKSFRKSFSSIDNSINKVFKYGAVAGVGALTLGLGLAAREFVSFDQAIVNAGARFTDLTIGTKEYDQSLVDLRKTARDVGATTQF
ncbi:MAG: hypothetical protein MIO92_10305, partial [Methanosarcinaceae archaeon]|nr:hypothetical protein [Methanosarcinaceae archaeon]